jgi:hypothetical protein
MLIGPTGACITYNAWKPKNTVNWWVTFGAQNLFVFGMERVHAVSKSHYTSVLPGSWSIGSEYTKLSRIIPSPKQILREPKKNEKYCFYVAFEGRVPWNDNEQFMFHTTMEKPCKRKKSQDI